MFFLSILTISTVVLYEVLRTDFEQDKKDCPTTVQLLLNEVVLVLNTSKSQHLPLAAAMGLLLFRRLRTVGRFIGT